eukprot:178388_1
MDNKQKDKKEIISLLKEMAETIANEIGDEIRKNCKTLRSVDSSSSAVILEEPTLLSGIIGNLLTNLVNDYDQNINLKESLINNLNKYLNEFCQCILERLYKSILS